MRYNDKKNSKFRIIVPLIVIVLLIGTLVYIFLINRFKGNATAEKDKSSTVASSGLEPNSTPSTRESTKDEPGGVYDGWSIYENKIFNYRIQYPQAWSKTEESQSTFVVLKPTEKSSTGITVVGIKSNTPPNEVIDLGKRTIFYSNRTSINGYDAYDVKFGDDTYINHCYVVSHEGVIVKICMNEMSKKLLIDNSKYIDQFNRIAMSLKF